MGRAVEVADSDRREARRGDPAEGPTPVEELVAVDQPVQAVVVAPEPAGRPERLQIGFAPVGMGCDDGRTEPPGLAERILEPGLERVEGAQAERESVRGLVGIRIVVSELEPRDDEQPVLLARAAGLALDRLQVVGVGSALQAERAARASAFGEGVIRTSKPFPPYTSTSSVRVSFPSLQVV
jgi:hypothetical protein